MPQDFSPLIVSLRAASLATVLVTVLGLASAWLLAHRRGWWRNLLDALFTLPLVLPPTVVGLGLLLMFGRSSAFGEWLHSVDLSPLFQWPATVIAAAAVAFPIMYRTSLGALEQVDREFIDVAETLGASRARTFLRITLPLAWPGVLAGVVLSFARALGEFGATLMLAGNIPGQTQTIPLAIYVLSDSGDSERAAAWAVIVSLISLVVTVAASRLGPRTVPSESHAEDFSGQEPVGPPRPAPALRADVDLPLGGIHLRASVESHGVPLGILGPSGAGKSMLLRCIAGLATPAAGRITVGERVLFDSDARINVPARDRRVGVIFQHYAVFPHLSVEENVAFGLAHLDPAERAERTRTLLRMVGLEPLRTRPGAMLSGGQQQRVALARALAPSPDVLLMDEPFSALDAYLRHHLATRIQKVLSAEGCAVVLVSHELEEAYRMCPQLAVIRRGQPVAHGPRETLFLHPPDVFTARFTGCKNLAPARLLENGSVEAWGQTLRVDGAQPKQATLVGIRAHHLVLHPPEGAPNTLRCWPISTSESPHRVSVMLSLRGPDDAAPELHAEVFKESWRALQDRPHPWSVQLPPDRLFLTRPAD